MKACFLRKNPKQQTENYKTKQSSTNDTVKLNDYMKVNANTSISITLYKTQLQMYKGFQYKTR